MAHGWQTEFWYVSRPADLRSYRLQAFGQDGIESGPQAGPTTSYDDDLIFETGSFVAYPDGPRR